jgi:hypothetical protein
MTMYEILTFNMKEHSTASNGQRQSDYHRDPVAVVDNGPVSAASVQSGPGYSYPGGTDAANDTGTISRFTMGPYARPAPQQVDWSVSAECRSLAADGRLRTLCSFGFTNTTCAAVLFQATTGQFSLVGVPLVATVVTVAVPVTLGDFHRVVARISTAGGDDTGRIWVNGQLVWEGTDVATQRWRRDLSNGRFCVGGGTFTDTVGLSQSRRCWEGEIGKLVVFPEYLIPDDAAVRLSAIGWEG